MNILTSDARRLSVALTGEDMRRLGITYAGLDPAKSATRRAILTVLDRAREARSSAPAFDAGLTIESLPCADDGCILIFSRREKNSRRFLCRVKDADAFLDCLRLCGEPAAGLCAYRLQGEYYLSFDACAAREALCEFGDVLPDDGVLRARLDEYGERLKIPQIDGLGALPE